MSYTITISGSASAAEGQTQEAADSQVMEKARQFASGLPNVSAAFIQTISGGMQSLTEQPQPPAAAPVEATGGEQSV